jgi:hypothetical protein
MMTEKRRKKYKSAVSLRRKQAWVGTINRLAVKFHGSCVK